MNSDRLITDMIARAEDGAVSTWSRRSVLNLNLQAGLLALGAAGAFGREAEAATREYPIPKVYRLFDGSDGISTSAEVGFGSGPTSQSSLKILDYIDNKEKNVAYNHPIHDLFRATFAPNAEVRVVTSSPSEPDGYHWPLTRELVYFIHGHWEFVPKSGKTLNVRPGSFLWAEDTQKGGGHTTRVVGPEWGMIIAIYGIAPDPK